MAVVLPFYKSYLSEEIRDEGRAQGLEQGDVQRAAEDVLLVLGQRGLEVSEEVRGRITERGDAELLRAWLVRAVSVSEAEEIFEGG